MSKWFQDLLVKHNDLITQIATCYQVFAHVNDFNTFLNNKDFPDKGTRQVQRVKNSIRQKIKDDKEESQKWFRENMSSISTAYMNETGTTHHAILPHHHTKRSDKRQQLVDKYRYE